MTRTIQIVLSLIAATVLAGSFSCKKSGGDPAEEMMAHMKSIFGLLKDNAQDCDKAVREVTSYIEKNKTALQEVQKQVKEMEAKMSEEEQKKMEEKMKTEAETMMKDAMTVMMDMSQRCPEQMKKIGEQMEFLRGE